MFPGKPVALVTGAGSGIGKSTAIRFGDQGCRVALVDRDETGLTATLELLTSKGIQAIGVRADVAVEDDVRMVVERTNRELGGLDFAFNNAGIGGVGKPLHEHSYDEFVTTLMVNLVGVWLCMKHELEVMLPQGKGVIVNTASALGLMAFSNVGAYVASKHGVVGLTRAAAAEYAAQGIRINCVCPGHTRTPINENYWKGHPEAESFMLGQLPVGRFAGPEEIAAVVTWLCSEEASFVHGHAFAVDGGMTIV
jgi:NAD(P)-dependent dehydrogenase (short-subunit alcohol dehydrogenase family)